VNPGSETFAGSSNTLVYSAMAVYTLAMLGYAAELAFGDRGRVGRVLAASRVGAGPEAAAPAPTPGRAERLGRVALALTVLAFGLHLAGLVARGLAAGRAPWGNMYEFSTAAALAAVGAYLVLLRRHDLGYLGIWVVSTALLTLGLAVVVFYTDAGELVPALRSYWLVIHVAAAVLAAGVFTVGAVASVLFLLRDRAERRAGAGRPGGYPGRLPASEALDRLCYRLHAFGFPVWTFAVVAGAIWAENAWGRYWGWDPKETWAFVTWVVYAGYLHARATAGWRGRRAAAVALVGYLALTFNYVGVNLWITGLHSYAGI
jgi:cytochrome c-type biogenesis protein CcsB